MEYQGGRKCQIGDTGGGQKSSWRRAEILEEGGGNHQGGGRNSHKSGGEEHTVLGLIPRLVTIHSISVIMLYKSTGILLIVTQSLLISSQIQ